MVECPRLRTWEFGPADGVDICFYIPLAGDRNAWPLSASYILETGNQAGFASPRDDVVTVLPVAARGLYSGAQRDYRVLIATRPHALSAKDRPNVGIARSANSSRVATKALYKRKVDLCRPTDRVRAPGSSNRGYRLRADRGRHPATTHRHCRP
jgi:hypothetical protein